MRWSDDAPRRRVPPARRHVDAAPRLAGRGRCEGPEGRRQRPGPAVRSRLAAAGHGAAGGAARPERGRPVPARPRRDDQRPAPGQRHLPRRCDRVAPARRVPPGRRTLHRARRGQPQRHLRQPGAGRVGHAEQRRRGADRQVPAGVHRRSAPEEATDRGDGVGRQRCRGGPAAGADEHRRGAGPAAAGVPDVTISKLRFLEAEGLVEPQRTPSGYRKYSRDDVERLRFVLDRPAGPVPAAAGDPEQLRGALDGGAADRWPRPAPARRSRRRGGAAPVGADGARLSPVRPSCADARRASTRRCWPTWSSYGLVAARRGRWYDARGADRRRGSPAQLAEYGLEPRHLRAYRAAADREVGLLAQLVAPLCAQQDRRPGRGRRRRCGAGGAVAAAARGAVRAGLHAALVG